MIRACQKFPAACPTTFSFQIIFGTSSTNQTEPGTIQAWEFKIIWISEVQGAQLLVASWLRLSRPLGAQASENPNVFRKHWSQVVRNTVREALEKSSWTCLRNTVRREIIQIFWDRGKAEGEILHSSSWLNLISFLADWCPKTRIFKRALALMLQVAENKCCR